MRLSRTQFSLVLNQIKSSKVFQNDHEKLQLPVHDQLAITLYGFGRTASVADIALAFGIGDGDSVRRVTARVIEVKFDHFKYPIVKLIQRVCGCRQFWNT